MDKWDSRRREEEWMNEIKEDRKTGGRVVAHSPKEHISDEPEPFRALFVIITQVAT